MKHVQKLSRLVFLVMLLATMLASCAAPATPAAVPTSVPPTAVPPTATAVPPTATVVPPTATAVPPTATAVPPTATAVPPTATVGPTATFVARNAGELLMATTTSTQDSGLLVYLLPMFEKQFNVKVKVVAVGSGQAIQLGKDGNADVLLVHSPAAEKAFMDAGDGIRREDVMYNDFVIVGPESDPAKISGIKTAADAFKAIADAKATFISRGDNSGTHTKEKSIWAALKLEPKGDWYVSAGQGMGAVLTMAQEKNAYTLADRATFLTQTQKGLALKILVEGDKLLLNPYGVIAVNPAKNSQIQSKLADQFIEWIISVDVQKKIAEFKKADFGISIFNPSSKLWKAANP
jgi:tungstate transport system substrate-binding protein